MATSTLTNLIGTSGFVRIQWTNAEQPANFYAWRLYQRRSGDTLWTKIYETKVATTSYTHDSYAWANNATQEIVLVYVTQNPTSGALAEGPYTGANSFTGPTDAKYWLVHPTDPSKTVTFAVITEEKFKNEMEVQIVDLLDLNGEGGGRKVNIGARFGRSGSFHATIHDHTTLGTATAQRQALELLYQLGSEVWLRNPFGDLTSVFITSLGDFNRVAGVGSMESIEVDISYVSLTGGTFGR